jgi:hypothetical protein
MLFEGFILACLYPLGGSVRTSTPFLPFVPLAFSGPPGPRGRSYRSAFRRENLTVDKLYAMHDGTVEWSKVIALIQKAQHA